MDWVNVFTSIAWVAELLFFLNLIVREIGIPDNLIVSDKNSWHNKGAIIQSPAPGGGGAGVFVADKLFISTWRGGPLKMSNFKTCLYEQFLK